METVSLSKAAELTGKSKSTISNDLKKGVLKGNQNKRKEWEINKDDLFALYPEKEQQKCERLEAELNEAKRTILLLENEISKLKAKLEDKTLTPQELENSSAPKNTPMEIINSDLYNPNDHEFGYIMLMGELLDFMDNKNLITDIDALNMLRRFLGSFICDLKSHTNPMTKRFIKSNDFCYRLDLGYREYFSYLIYGSIPHHWSDYNINEFLCTSFNECILGHYSYQNTFGCSLL